MLHNIASYNPATLEKSALPILKGLSLCIEEPNPLRNEITNLPAFWKIISNLKVLPEAAANTFDVVSTIVAAQPPAITGDNYKEVVGTLNHYAAAGSVGAIVEQKRDKMANARKKEQKTTKPAKPRENEVVDRGYRAVLMIYQLTGRVPALIEQSRLQRNEGMFNPFSWLRSSC